MNINKTVLINPARFGVLAYSNDDLTIQANRWGFYCGTVSNNFKNDGKYYHEVTIDIIDSCSIGVTRNPNKNDGGYSIFGAFAEEYAYVSNGNKINAGKQIPYGNELKAGDTLGIAINLVEGNIKFILNGVDLGIAYSDIPKGDYYIGNSLYYTGGNTTVTFNFGTTPLKNIPAGYKAFDAEPDKFLIKKENLDDLYDIDENNPELVYNTTNTEELNFINNFEDLKDITKDTQYGKAIDKLDNFILYKMS